MRHLRLYATSAVLLALGACTVGPNYSRPDVAGAPQWSEKTGGQPGATLSTVTASTASLDRWWTQFNDPVLDDLVRRALRDNLTLAQARARVRQAREQVIVARAAQLPTLSGTTTAARVDTQSQNLGAVFGNSMSSGGGAGASAGGAAAAGAASSSSGGGPNRIEAFQLGLNAAWELDLFGAVRRQVEAARDQQEAQVWSARDTQVSVASQVADAYVQLRLAQARAQVLRQDLSRQEGLFKIIGDRFRTGFVTNLDVDQQRVQLANTQSQIPQQDAAADAQAHAIATLLGLTPEALHVELSPVKALPPVPPTIPAGLPSDLVRRRPDIRASERQLAAANAAIGSAVAAHRHVPRGVSTFATGKRSRRARASFCGSSPAWSSASCPRPRGAAAARECTISRSRKCLISSWSGSWRTSAPPARRPSPPATPAATCSSPPACAKAGSAMRVAHPVSLLAEAYRSEPGAGAPSP